MATRYWFRASELYGTPPFTMFGVLATSWEEATKILMNAPETRTRVCIAPAYYFLSCNVERWNTFECSEEAAVIVKEFPKPKKARSVKRYVILKAHGAHTNHRLYTRSKARRIVARAKRMFGMELYVGSPMMVSKEAVR